MTWRNRPTSFNKTVKNLVSDTVREIGVDALAQVVQRSPVRTGRYKGNHNVGVGAIDESLSGIANDSNSRGGAKLGVGLDDFPVVFISNALPYAKKLEDGSSGQAKDGIYRPTFTFISAKYKRVIR